jgi:hypothetical protein
MSNPYSGVFSLFCSALFIFMFSMLSLVPASCAQDPQSPSVVDAAREARERQERSGRHPRVITNEDLEELNRNQRPLRIEGTRSRSKPEFPASPSIFTHPRILNAAQVQDDSFSGCEAPHADQLRAQIGAAEQDLEALQRENDAQGPVISDNGLDLQYFQPGQSGLNVGSPPRLDSQPQSQTRVAQQEVQDRLDALRKQLQIACEPPEIAVVQRQLDQAESDLDLAQRQFALDQEAYYQQPASPNGAQGNAWLDSERQQVVDLQALVDELRAELASAQASTPSSEPVPPPPESAPPF